MKDADNIICFFAGVGLATLTIYWLLMITGGI